MSVMLPRFGLGLRPLHYGSIVADRPNVDFFECLTEDYIQCVGDDFDWLQKISTHYPITLHGVALSIGGCDPLNQEYLAALKKLIHHVNPLWVSDHFCWTGVDGINSHDLLPLPFTEESISHLVSRITQVQDFLGQRILLENVSSYFNFTHSQLSEAEFISEVANRADCDLLLDINNVFVNAFNHGFCAEKYFETIPKNRVKQFHLAGHKHCQTHIIDTHDTAISNDVWDLYKIALGYFSDVPLVIERDSNIPPLEELMTELTKAKMISSD